MSGWNEACRECHPKAYAIWKDSKHGHAFQVLADKGNQYNPRCLQCHTVGYMESDGYINERLTPHLKNVSCETCHGRGGFEVRLRKGQPIPVKKLVLKSVMCTKCHTPDDSPNFDLNTYWKKIAHGKD